MKLPLVIGHRGAKGIAPENSLSGFKKAVELGIDGVELDVHLAKNGKLVVIHDVDLKRLTRLAVSVVTCKQAAILIPFRGSSLSNLFLIVERTGICFSAHSILSFPFSAESISFIS